MSLNACQLAIQSLINGAACPGIPTPLVAYVEPPPVVQTADGPVAYVWGGQGDEQRATIPRGGNSPFPGGGQKRIAHTTEIILQWACETGSEYEQLFPLVIDTVRAILRKADLRIPTIDPTTGEASQMTDLGERMQWTYSTPIATSPASQQMRLNTAVLRLPYHEWVSG